MKKLIILFFLFIKFDTFSQFKGRNEIVLLHTRSLFYSENLTIKRAKLENNTSYHFNQIQLNFDHIFQNRSLWSFQTGFSLSLQSLKFKNVYQQILIYSPTDPLLVSIDDYQIITENQLSLNLNLQFNYMLKNIWNHSSYLDISCNYNGITFDFKKVKSDYYDPISTGKINRTNGLYAGTHLHWALFKEPTPRTIFLVLGLNYEFYNTPRLYNYRIFATVGLAVQFGKKKEIE